MAIIDNMTYRITLKNFMSTQKRINKLTKKLNKLTKKLNKLNKAADECAEAFKNFKQCLPIEIEVEEIDGGKNE